MEIPAFAGMTMHEPMEILAFAGMTRGDTGG
jgi:hypothetical protein